MKIKQFSVSLFLAVGAGVAQFGGQLLLARDLSPSNYSQIALVLGMVSSYLLLSDLGTQVFFTRLLSTQNTISRVDFDSMLGVRIFLCLIALTIGAVHLRIMGFQGIDFWGSLAVLASAGFISVLQIFEIIGYKAESAIGSQLSRVLRGFSWVLFSLCSIVMFGFDKLRDNNSFITILYASVVTVIFALVVGLSYSRFSFLSGKFSTNSTANRTHFIKHTFLLARRFSSEYHFAFGFALNWASHAAMSITLVSIWTQQGLSQFYLAQTLSNPVALSIQIVSGSILAHANFFVSRFTRLLIALIVIGSTFGCLLIHYFGHKLQFVIPALQTQTSQELMFQIIGIAIPAWSGVIFAKEHQNGQKNWMWAGPALSFGFSLIYLFAAQQDELRKELSSLRLSFMWCIAQCLPTLVYCVLKFFKPFRSGLTDTQQ